VSSSRHFLLTRRLGALPPWELAVRTWKKIEKNEILTRAAAVAFYAMLASVPFLGLLLTILVQLLPDLSHVTGRGAEVGERSVTQLESTLAAIFPKDANVLVVDQIAALQKQLQYRPPIALFAIGLATMLWSASTLFTAIIEALDRIHGVIETRSWVKMRLVAMFMTIVEAVILLAAVIAVVAGQEILAWLGFRGLQASVGRVIQVVVVWVMVLFSFALTYSIGPNVKQKCVWITPGSVIGSSVFLGSSYLFRVYAQNFANYDRIYGSLGGVMILLFWFWICATVLLAAGQLNKVIDDASCPGETSRQD
jgi:membrane protein